MYHWIHSNCIRSSPLFRESQLFKSPQWHYVLAYTNTQQKTWAFLFPPSCWIGRHCLWIAILWFVLLMGKRQHGYFFLDKLSLTVKHLLRKQKVLCEILTFRRAALAYTMSCASFREFHMLLRRYIGLHPSLCFSHILKKGDHSSRVKWNGKITLNPGLLTCPVVQQLLFS